MHSSTTSNKVTLLWSCYGNSLRLLHLLPGSVATEVQVPISQVLTQVHSINLETSGYQSVKLDVSHGAGSWEDFSQLPLQKSSETTNHALHMYTVPQFTLKSVMHEVLVLLLSCQLMATSYAIMATLCYYGKG